MWDSNSVTTIIHVNHTLPFLEESLTEINFEERGKLESQPT
jgi:hypothetical protein